MLLCSLPFHKICESRLTMFAKHCKNRFPSFPWCSFAFSCFSPPIELFVKFHIQFSFHFCGSFSKIFLSLAWMRFENRSVLLFLFTSISVSYLLLKCRRLRFRSASFTYLPLNLLFEFSRVRFSSALVLDADLPPALPRQILRARIQATFLVTLPHLRLSLPFFLAF